MNTIPYGTETKMNIYSKISIITSGFGEYAKSKSSTTKTQQHITTIRANFAKLYLLADDKSLDQQLIADLKLLSNPSHQDMIDYIKKSNINRAERDGLINGLEREYTMNPNISNSSTPKKTLNMTTKVKEITAEKWETLNFIKALEGVNEFISNKHDLDRKIAYPTTISCFEDEKMTRGVFEVVWKTINDLIDPAYKVVRSREKNQTDDICMLQSSNDNNGLCKFIVEYKLPSKFPICKRKNKGNDKFNKDIESDEYNFYACLKNPADFMESRIYDPDHCAVKQIRNYMLENHIKYGIICIFNQFVFCFIDENDPYFPIYLTERFDAFTNPIQLPRTSSTASSLLSTKTIDTQPLLSDDPSTWSIYQLLTRFIFFVSRDNNHLLKKDKIGRIVKYHCNNKENVRSKQSEYKENLSKDKDTLSSKEGEGGGKSSASMSTLNDKFELVSWYDIKTAEVIAEGRTGPVYRKFINGKDCICKCLFIDEEVDEYEESPSLIKDELDREVDVYEQLKELQGNIIPELLAYEVLMYGTIYMIVTEYAGEIIHEEIGLNKKQIESARKGLNELHNRGILHGDIRLCNMVINKNNNNEVMFIDFGFAKFKQEFNNENDWNEAVEKERNKLERELPIRDDEDEREEEDKLDNICLDQQHNEKIVKMDNVFDNFGNDENKNCNNRQVCMEDECEDTNLVIEKRRKIIE